MAASIKLDKQTDRLLEKIRAVFQNTNDEHKSIIFRKFIKSKKRDYMNKQEFGQFLKKWIPTITTQEKNMLLKKFDTDMKG